METSDLKLVNIAQSCTANRKDENVKASEERDEGAMES